MKRYDEGEDIKVNRRSSDKIYFESPLIQSISDGIDFLRDETKEILEELDSTEFKQKIDELNLEEFGEYAAGQISEITDEISKFKSEIFNSEDIPEFVKESSVDAKRALNMDADYVRRAQRRLDMLDSNEPADKYRINMRVIELCDKALEVNYKNWQAYYVKSQALINLGRYEDAISELVKSLALNENNCDAWFDIARSYKLNGEYEEAIAVYDSILKRDNESFGAYIGKAYVYYDIEDYQNADNFCKKANSIESLDEDSKMIWVEVQNNL